MKKTKKMVLLVVMAVITSMMLMACGSTGAPSSKESPAPSSQEAPSSSAAESSKPAAEKELNIVYVPPLIAHPVWLVAKQGFEDAQKDLGFKGQWVGPSTNDVNEVVKQIEIAIASKADGIITYGAAPDAMVPVLKQADEAGIPVVCVIGDVPDAPKLGFMGTDPQNFGETGAKVLSEKLGSVKPMVIGQMFAMDAAQNIANFKGYKDGLAKNPAGFEWLDTNASNSDQATGMQAWENSLIAHPECNAMVCSSGESAVSAAKVLKEKNLVGKITIIGIDDMEETLDYIRSGEVYATLSQNFYRCGYQAAQWIVDYNKTGKKPSPDSIDTGTIVITKENVDTYINELKDRSQWK
ncbi:substrate-binding domain-containing protein [Petroclostridium sp. X23]|uniref:substrate-binding domain-containing protein n=1 Tax=Petroclostridium sp. X23 TaxID=3045146 RepID=UPI0024ACD3E7|nr:substrate-binding domain-containing protein [Petroclostridium sp. X23]WHH60746.1 substrate-binding domain-containing protein [Petroclostridium sp. X23]